MCSRLSPRVPEMALAMIEILMGYRVAPAVQLFQTILPPPASRVNDLNRRPEGHPQAVEVSAQIAGVRIASI